MTITATDSDGDSTTTTFELVVNNVAPAATFENDGPVDEGSAFTLSLTGPSDPSGADTNAGFEYAFDCGDGNGYSPWSGDHTLACPTRDDGLRAVKGKIKDKDDGETEYSATVTVLDLGPTAAFEWAPEPQEEGSATSFADKSTSAPDAIVAWAWDFGGLDTSDRQNDRALRSRPTARTPSA